ncbi:hypothetical protein LCGC14_0376550 [marine sediment metagenome]|uniref:Uncharacterized protein n=1 Tax=marine sediment metagenome TaxID=412755 RepID=A0A0F9T9D7_9ZZZZ
MSHADGLQAMADGCEIQKNWIPSWNKYKETIDPGTMQCDIYAAGYYTARRELQDLIDDQVAEIKRLNRIIELDAELEKAWKAGVRPRKDCKDAEMSHADEIEAMEDAQEIQTKPTGVSLTHTLSLRHWDLGRTGWKIWAKDAIDLIDRQAEQLKAKDEVEARLRKSWHEAEETLVVLYAENVKLDDLKDTVRLACSTPDDCNDPVVLKQYMKACFDKAMAIED